MALWKKALPLLLLIGVWSGCDETVLPPDPVPGRVVLTEKSPDSVAVERGIDAEDPPDRPDPDRNGILVEWRTLDDDELSRYAVYRRAIDSLGNFQRVALVSPPDTSYIDTEVGLDTTYFYYVRGTNRDGDEGDPSRTDFYRLEGKPLLISPDNFQVFAGTFRWEFARYVSQYFILRIERQVATNRYEPHLLRLLEVVANVQPEQVWTAAQAGIGTLPSGTYRWRVDVRNFRDRFPDNREGAESAWGEFVVP